MAGTLATVKLEDMSTGLERVLSFMLQEGDCIEVRSNSISVRVKHSIAEPLEPPPKKGRHRENHFFASPPPIFYDPQPIAKPQSPPRNCPVKPGAPSQPPTNTSSLFGPVQSCAQPVQCCPVKPGAPSQPIDTTTTCSRTGIPEELRAHFRKNAY